VPWLWATALARSACSPPPSRSRALPASPWELRHSRHATRRNLVCRLRVPAVHQLVNAAAKLCFCSHGTFDCGALIVRMPYGALVHSGLYHSQSPKAHIMPTPGLVMVTPRSPAVNKDLPLACIDCRHPCGVPQPKSRYLLVYRHVLRGPFHVRDRRGRHRPSGGCCTLH
jgi:pyruvate/2-oxoglutarate/acetoin dehydrogenase E1 component